MTTEDSYAELQRQHETARRMLDVVLRNLKSSDQMLWDAVQWYQEIGWRLRYMMAQELARRMKERLAEHVAG